MSANTTYYLRAYATNSPGTAYGNHVSFKTRPTDFDTGNFTDTRDGIIYKWVKIGEQIWMAENLKYLPSIVGPGTDSQTVANYYVYGYNGTDVTAAKATANYQNYGVLYNWPAAIDRSASNSTNPSGVQGVCPPGWHVPSRDEWTDLVNYVVSQGYPNNNSVEVVAGAGNALKSCRQDNSPFGGGCNTSDHPLWISYNIHYGIDLFGFSAVPGGLRISAFGSGKWNFTQFEYISSRGYWWSATEDSSTRAWYRKMDSGYGDVYRRSYYKADGFSVRRVRD